MKKQWYYLFLSSFLLLAGCKSGGSDPDTGDTDGPPKKFTFEERAERHITGSLAIGATEKFKMETFKGHLNSDNFEDAIISVNRLDFAKKNVKNLKNADQIEKLGYMGNYNAFIFYDGKVDKFSVPVVIPSSAARPLSIKFENIISPTYFTLTVEYNINNSAYRNYYTMNEGVLHKIFQVKLYDMIGTPNPEVYYLEFDKGTISAVNDIVVYQGKIKNYSTDIKDVFNYIPEIEKTNKLVRRWFYSPGTNAYMTEDPDFDKRNAE